MTFIQPSNQNDTTLHDNLIFDIGFHRGDDTAYYLSLGYRVVAVEANPVLAEAGRKRFAPEIQSGCLVLLNIGVWHTRGSKLSFYVNQTDNGWSSFIAERGQRGGKYQVEEVQCMVLADLYERYGIPWYLKVDIEGADEAVVSALTQQTAPAYFSCELSHNSGVLDVLVRCGYAAFKLINQETFTQSLPIFDDQLGVRALRKLSTLFPSVKSLISNLPDGLRPKHTYWDTFRTRYTYKFIGGYCSGPFGEDTEGRWSSESDIRSRLDYVFRQYTRYGREQDLYFDLHARRGDYQ